MATTPKDPVLEELDNLRHEEEANAPSSPARRRAAAKKPATKGAKAPKAAAKRSSASKAKATDAPAKRSSSRTTERGPDVDPDDITAAVEAAIQPLAVEVKELGKKVRKQGKRATNSGSSEEEREVALVEKAAGKAHRNEKKRQRKEKDDKLKEAAEAGGVLAAGGTPKIDLSKAGAEGVPDPAAIGDKKIYTEDELRQYYRENKKLPADALLTGDLVENLREFTNEVDGVKLRWRGRRRG